MLKKLCLFSWVLSLPLTAADQIVLVVAENFEDSKATLQRFTKVENRYETAGKPITVNIGRNGLGWGIGIPFKHHENEPLKYEGDGKAPAGIFALSSSFGYAATIDSNMPYTRASRDLICIDDSSSPYYNRIKTIDPSTQVKSFEWMRRDDGQYEIGVTVDHNPAGITKRGSCIFLHVEKAPGAPTAGCTAMPKTELEKIVNWLDPQSRPLLVQIPRSYCKEIAHRYNGVSCP